MNPLQNIGAGPLMGLPTSPQTKQRSKEFGEVYQDVESQLVAPSTSLAEPFEAPTTESADLLGPVGQYLNEVNRLQIDAKDQQEFLASGGDIDLHQVMISAEKAGIALQTTLAIRGKVMEAYQEIMRMQV